MTVVISQIDALLEAQPLEQRTYLGASQLGRKCERELYLAFHWALKPKREARLLRLFERGHLTEKRFFAWLEGIGFTVTTDLPPMSLLGGHFGGRPDAILNHKVMADYGDPPYLLELKTYNADRFKRLEAATVKLTAPEYYSQVQLYLGGYKLTQCLFLAINKNNDALYEEWIPFDEEHYVGLLVKAQDVIFHPEAPPRLSESPAWFECKMCDYHTICQKPGIPDINCRTCHHSIPVREPRGGWQCALNRPEIGDQRGCQSHHLFRPSMLKGVSVLGYSDEDRTFDLFNHYTKQPFLLGEKGVRSSDLCI